MPHSNHCLQGVTLDEETTCSLAELCHICAVHAEEVLEMIDEGLISPSGPSPAEWQFGAIEIRRVQTARRLQQDLRVNLPGCALALELLEELEELRRLVRML
ncbi:MAG: MerR family transcriptional regulator [Desulfobulbus propionicus]|nr:MAG: MerR family transcriptional regulator [Desulfobulbus propionicus]